MIITSVAQASRFSLKNEQVDTTDFSITSPVSLNVYPAKLNNGSGPGRIYINAMRIGGVPITLPLLFDTGSAGVTLDALKIFPPELVDEHGFKFKKGQDTLTYKGIVVTRTTVQKVYGSAGAVETKEFGNIGFATLMVGDQTGALNLRKMPVMFFYAKSTNGKESTNGLGSVFGVNTTFNTVTGVNERTTFNLVSPLKYLNYRNGLIPGFKLSALQLFGCAIKIPGSCRPSRSLTVGLTNADFQKYRFNQLTPQATAQTGQVSGHFPTYPELPLYHPEIAAAIATESQQIPVSVLLDSGNPGVVLNASSEDLHADQYPIIKLMLPFGQTYFYNQRRANFSTRFNPSSKRSVFGIYFFTVFGFAEDYQNGRIGLNRTAN
ncbi:hypothetical protein FPZ42_12170 [Mucilaginibacter achroorhodeus]|uniref:Aspartyl protease n=1 Tax=Mucilaginibacter achroorhodeus TaxID=2599294 RepID=A0A563U134_9SPHI|nr:hypothetical protein [Mucilaginibacter achroorhodeus]TWR25355.1 hypothetical protein FPZ42_12170 [Mucilaginibacter achroorhodeus]